MFPTQQCTSSLYNAPNPTLSNYEEKTFQPSNTPIPPRYNQKTLEPNSSLLNICPL